METKGKISKLQHVYVLMEWDDPEVKDFSARYTPMVFSELNNAWDFVSSVIKDMIGLGWITEKDILYENEPYMMEVKFPNGVTTRYQIYDSPVNII